MAQAAARFPLKSKLQFSSATASMAWPQQFLLFAIFFAGLMLLHSPLLRLPYFWDEAGYYVPAARDLYLTGTLIPQTTISNAHPPLVMAWLALAWRIFGYSTLVTRTAMLAVAAFSLLGLFRLAQAVANLPVAFTVTALTAIYPVFFTQSSLAQVDLAAAGLTFWGLLAYIEDRPLTTALWFSLAALAKETGILAALALFGWQVLATMIRARVRPRWEPWLPPLERRTTAFYLLVPVLPLVCWFAYHRAKTGFAIGNPAFLRYNLTATLNPLRIPLAFLMRLWQVTGYLGLYVLTIAALLALFQPPLVEQGVSRSRIAIWQQAALGTVVLVYLLFMSAAGGAVLARYLLPAVPLVILAMVSTLWRRFRYWRLIAAAAVIAFAAALFTNPPYGFSLEDNLAYRDYVVMHAEASRFLTMVDPKARVLTAWPASDELSRPWLGYVAKPFHVIRMEDFTAAQISAASAARTQFDVVLAFSTKYHPPHELLGDWPAWSRIKEEYFGYHRDLLPDEIARQIGGRVIFRKENNGQWIAVIVLDKANEQ